jgi:hypothetical protein
MSSILQKKDAAESFIWSDGRFESVSLSDGSSELTIDYTDYCSNRFRFRFQGVAELVVSDPVYCIRSSHQHEAGKKKLVLYDDDRIVISFRYDGVQQCDATA